ncbi:hypothetical protein IEQ34_011246 [Dendrobium chrysotoxum]|uniref:Retrotransposon gag domain-containing protein n=1 Tax=Dendrobium chrysotoxum TaxID=161865 RepID=A0AAV7GY01_DENCH|nr:hypothetical protein IEQ34_011246 [Dendrobium chrysotoxum]
MDKYIKLFQDTRPLLFKGVEILIEAENWLLRIEKILEGMFCPEKRKISLATFVLDGEAKSWWKGEHQYKFGGVPDIKINWDDFTKCSEIGLFMFLTVICFTDMLRFQGAAPLGGVQPIRIIF